MCQKSFINCLISILRIWLRERRSWLVQLRRQRWSYQSSSTSSLLRETISKWGREFIRWRPPSRGLSWCQRVKAGRQGCCLTRLRGVMRKPSLSLLFVQQGIERIPMSSIWQCCSKMGRGWRWSAPSAVFARAG